MKNRTLTIILTITLLVLGCKTHAEENMWPSVTISSLVADKYRGFGTGNLLSKDPVIQSDVFILFKNGFYVDFWFSRSLKGSWNDGSLGNEIDYHIGWKGNLTTNLSLNIGISYCDQPEAFTFGAGDSTWTHAFLTKDFKHLSVTAGFENFTTMPESGFQGGNLFSLGVSKYQSICKGKIGLRASAADVYDTGTLGSGEGIILRGSTGADWNVSKRLTLNVIGCNWYIPVTPHDKRKADTVISTGFTLHL